MKGKRGWIALVIVLLLLAAWGWKASAVHEDARRRAEREAEAHKAKLAEIVVAEQAKRRVLSAQVDEMQGTIAAQIDHIRQVTGKKPKIREVVKWQTEQIEVPVERLVLRDVPVKMDCPPPAGYVTFDVRGSEVRLESELGNWFAVGDVELWRTAPGAELLLGGAPWRADVTELIVDRDVVARPLPLQAVRLLGHTDGGIRLGYSRYFSKRFAWTVEADYGAGRVSFDQFSYQPDVWRFAAGVEVRW